jgi:endonuclease YncB( thermonuclease family)
MLIVNSKTKCQVVEVTDGDTLTLNYKGEIFKARLQWIDAPETNKKEISYDLNVIEHWKYGLLAKGYLQKLLVNKVVTIIPIIKDIYSRWVIDCYISTNLDLSVEDELTVENNVQIALCKLGLAVSYYLPTDRYEYNDRELDLLLGIIRETAFSNRTKLGFWNCKKFNFPHNFRKMKFDSK